MLKKNTVRKERMEKVLLALHIPEVLEEGPGEQLMWPLLELRLHGEVVHAPGQQVVRAVGQAGIKLSMPMCRG